MHFILILLFICLNSLSWAQVDPLNTYQWNRKNFFQNSGRVDKNPWFEWWFYKMILPDTGESFYFVYGVVNPWDGAGRMKGTRSYVGMGDFKSKKIVEQKYPLKDFIADYKSVNIQVGEHQATDRWFKGQLIDPVGADYSWNISIEKQWSFPGTGWALGRNITSIEWYPAQADAVCSGWVQRDSQFRQFVDVPCYQDRNWGALFPEWWTWIVSNHFENHPETTLTVGGGRPHVYGIDIGMEGVVVGLKHKGIEYQFRPNDFDSIKMDIKFGKWFVEAQDGKYKLKIEAYAPKEDFMDLQFMTPDGSIFHDYETLTGYVKVHLYKSEGVIFKKWILMETLISNFAGIEYGSGKINEFEKLFSDQKTLLPLLKD
ncbi:MAG TPA: tocopherol cyclase family protein [Pseudobdellovibrionaceae bacterium]|nr:tocopherol cyclase family protein [Pseudobdellovibrionaceae bacterium]